MSLREQVSFCQSLFHGLRIAGRDGFSGHDDAFVSAHDERADHI
jgi:hypothetical protein